MIEPVLGPSLEPSGEDEEDEGEARSEIDLKFVEGLEEVLILNESS